MASNISKIERVNAPNNAHIWVDLKLNKQRGVFFADVGVERIASEVKAEAVKKTQEALSRVTQTVWREVILIRVDNRSRSEITSHENNKPVFGASCSFTYMRRERAQNPIKPKECIEREHREDFEMRIAERREREAYFGYSRDEKVYSRDEKKKRADEVEARMREDRMTLRDAGPQWSFVFDEDKIVEYEIPYSEEAWRGVQRIAQALRDTQAKLNEFARGVTPERLAALATGDVLKQLLPAPVTKKSK